MLNNAQNEAMAEQLREKRRYYGEQEKEVDFFMVPEPKFLESNPEIAKRVKRPAIALITEDPVWCT